MLFVDQTELIILLVVCAIAAGCFIATVALTVWVMINRQRGQKAKRELTGISVDAAAAKQTFAAGEEFTCEGLIVNAAYNMEPTEEALTKFDVLTEAEFAHLAAAGAANGLYVIKPDMAEEGKDLVIIRYRDRAAYYPITVSAPIREVQTPAEEVQAEQTEPEAIEEAPAEAEEAAVVEERAEVEEAPAEIPEPVAEVPMEIPTVLFEGSGVRYNRSFTAKLIQSDDEVKGWYTALKNELLSYKKVKSRMSWKRESFRLGRNITARFAFRGNTLCIYLPLDPAFYEGTKYKVEDASGYASYADTPCMYRVKGARRARYAAELIAASMDALGIGRIEREAEEYYLPYENTEALIGRGLIKYENAGNAGGAFLPQSAAEEVAIAEEVPAEEVVESADEPEAIAAEVPEETPAEVPAEEETTEEPVEEQPAEEEAPVEESVPEEEPEEEPTGEPTVEETAEIPEEPTEEAIKEAEVEELSTQELYDVQAYEEEAKDEDGIEVVGVMFRHRGRKVYWFDPDGKTWAKGEIALYKSPDDPPQEVIVVDNAKISPSKLHLPLKPLHKATVRSQTSKKQ